MDQLQHGAMDPVSLFSESDYQPFMSRLYSLLAKQTESYTMGDSSSVRVETAEELMRSLWYTLTLLLNEKHLARERLLTDDLWQLMNEGQMVLSTKLEQTKQLWEAVCRTAPDIRNFYYTLTLRGIGDYLRRYDLHFFAHRIPLDLDYPLLCPVPDNLQGLTYTGRYLRNLLTENSLLRQLDQSGVIRVLEALAPDYPDNYLSLCQQPLTNALGLTLIGKPGHTLLLDDPDREQIKAVLQLRSPERVKLLLSEAAQALCRELKIEDETRRAYLTEFAESLLPRLRLALDSDDLSCFFVDGH